METNNNELIERESVGIVEGSTEIHNADDITLKLADKDTRDETFRTFEDYRRASGDRGIFGKKVYFATMIDIGVLERCSKGENAGTFKPTVTAQIKYPEMFSFDAVNKIWGFSYLGTDEFDDKVLHIFIKAAKVLDTKIELQQKQDRADKAKIRRRQREIDAYSTGVSI